MHIMWSDQRIKTSIFLLFVAIFLIFFLSGGPQWLSLDNLKHHREALLDYAEQNYWIFFLVSGVIYILTTTFSLPGATILSLAVGFLFGRWMGTLLIVISATIGATLVFLLARYLIADWARERLRKIPQTAKIMQGFQIDAFNYLLFLRLIPVFPFWLVNLVPAFTPVSTKTYIITTLIGIVPGSFVYANLGRSLGQIDRLDQLWSLPVITAFSLLGLLALAPVIAKYYKQSQSPEHR